MTTQHTPGPWNYSQESVDPEWWIVTLNGGLIVANVNAHAYQEANARLIATAPDLLAVAKDTRNTLEAWRDDAILRLRRAFPKDEAPFANMRDNYNALLEPLNAAIAKATEQSRPASIKAG